MEPRKFQYIGGTSRKFWEIYEPDEVSGKQLGYGESWQVRVRFGRIGQWGQERVKLFTYKSGARNYYNEKVNEKLLKGYKETGKPTVKKDVVDYTPTYAPPPKPAPVCSHANLQTCGTGKWKCVVCKKEIDFGDTNIVKESDPIAVVQVTVRRFFASKGE